MSDVSDDIWPDGFTPVGQPISSTSVVIVDEDKYRKMQARITALEAANAELRESIAILEAHIDEREAADEALLMSYIGTGRTDGD